MVAFPIEAEYAKREKECGGRRAVDFLRLLGGGGGGGGGVFSLSATADIRTWRGKPSLGGMQELMGMMFIHGTRKQTLEKKITIENVILSDN